MPPEKTDNVSPVLDAIRAKRERRKATDQDIADIEASLIADIESFDINEAERLASREQLASLGAGMVDATLAFPEIVPDGVTRDLERRGADGGQPDPTHVVIGSNLLGQLRVQAEERRRELNSETAARSASNLALDQAMKYLFFYFHDLVQQLNVVKPAISRQYSAAGGDIVIGNLVWQEGFADYRTQSQAAGAMLELVTLSCQLASPTIVELERDGPAVDRLRNAIFDYGLQFECKEYRNQRRYLERAEFRIRGQIGVSARWKADFANGVIVLESRNLERFGTAQMVLQPTAIDQALLDEFGGLLLGHANQFRELARR